MSAAPSDPTGLIPDIARATCLRTVLDDIGFDAAQQALRPDYFTSPYPHYEEFQTLLDGLEVPLATAFRLLALAQCVPATQVETALGSSFVNAGIGVGLLRHDSTRDTLATTGYSIVSRLGQLFAVSINPYYPTFQPTNASVYMGPDSFALAAHLQRLARWLPAHGSALDLCAGSGVAGATLAAWRPGQRWTAVDLSPSAVAAARFNAVLNDLPDHYTANAGDLFAPVAGTAFDLIVANPPFIPVPDGHEFPGYGNGGEDGLLVIEPLIRGLRAYLGERGAAVIYSEGLGDASGPFLLRLLQRAATDDGLDFQVQLIASTAIEQALYTLGLMLSRQRPSRLPEIVAWKESFERQAASRYYKLFVIARRGDGMLRVTSLARAM